MRRFCLLVMLVAFPLIGSVAAERTSKDGDLYVLGIALNQHGAAGGWAQLGPNGAWKTARVGVTLQGRVYTVDSDGTLRSASLANGQRTQIGKPDFKETAFLFGADDKLYTIETNGNLFQVSTRDGSRTHVGAKGDWKAVQTGVISDGKLYTAEKDDSLQATDLTTGKRNQIRKTRFGTTKLLFAIGSKLYAIDTKGNLILVKAEDGSRTRVGVKGAWKSVRAGVVFRGKLYTAENDGSLQATDLTTGKRSQVGNAAFGGTTFMLATANAIFTIESSGNLFLVNVTPSQSIEGWNCFPIEVERIFRDHGKAFYRQLYARQILGKHATRAAVMDGLAWLRQHATKKDLVVMYITAHGHCPPRQGWVFSAADGKAVTSLDLRNELGKLPCQALALIESCQSGGFAKDLPNHPLPSNVTALCGCLPEQLMDNEFDISLFEALCGRADFNKDGTVDLDETIKYIELRYKEWWWWPRPKLNPILRKAKSLQDSLPLTRAASNLATVVHNGMLSTALLEKQDGDKYHVHLLGWDWKPGPYYRTNVVHRDNICLPSEGQPLLVERDGTWSPARLLQKEGEKYKVLYIGKKNKEELVTIDRIRHPFVGKPGEVFPTPAGAATQVGMAEGWQATLAGAVLNDRLYSVNKKGRFYRTNLDTGKRHQIGSASFGATAFLFASGEYLYSIEKDGNLFRVDPKDGSRTPLGQAKNWKDTRLGTVLKDRLCTIGADGCLYVTDLPTGERKQVGDAKFGTTAFLFAAAESLYTIAKNGNLYRVNPKNGKQTRLGQQGDWRGTVAGTVLQNRLCTVENSGGMFATKLTQGVWSQIGMDPEFRSAAFMFTAKGKLYTLLKSGTLYRMSVK